jgi:hypothetical protein
VEDIGSSKRIILKWILRNGERRMCTGLMWPKTGTSGGFCEDRNELSGSMKSVNP